MRRCPLLVWPATHTRIHARTHTRTTRARLNLCQFPHVYKELYIEKFKRRVIFVSFYSTERNMELAGTFEETRDGGCKFRIYIKGAGDGEIFLKGSDGRMIFTTG